MLNIKSTKKALVTGIISMSLCSAMLVGSTYAWFTSTTTVENSEIQAGNLEVTAAYDKTGLENVKFEPGAVVYEKVDITNNGDVKAKCRFNIDLDTAGDFANAVQVAIIEDDPKSADLSTGFVDLSAYDFDTAKEIELDESTGANPTKSVYVVLKWKDNNSDSVDNDLMGQKFNFSVNIVATQNDGDTDGIGKNDYDENATYPAV